VTIVQGLASGKVVVVNRAHHAMLDGIATVDILSLLLDADPGGTGPPLPPQAWEPRPAPSGWQLFRRVLWDPSARGTGGVRVSDAWRAWRQPWIGWWNLGRSMAMPDQELFWNRSIGPKRTGRGLKVPLTTFKALKNRYRCTVNDAVLAVIAEGLHEWFTARG